LNVDTSNRTRSGGNQPHIVIAYTYADHDFAHKLAGALRREGVSPWIDEVDMSVGVILVNRVAHSVRPIDFIIPVISASSVSAGWVRTDLKILANRDSRSRTVRLLPARIDGTVLPDHLRTQSYIDFHANGWKKAFGDLNVILKPNAIPRPPLRQAPEFELPHPIRRPQPAAARKAEAKLVFVSYDYENDGNYRDLLVTWSQSPDFPRLSVNDQPVTCPVDSDEAEPLKHAVHGKIKSATAFLCLVGEKTSASAWVDWEIKTAIELEKRMVVARTNRDCVVPDVLSEVGPTCAMSFTFEGIKRAVDEAYGVVCQE
jgi:hypothetical protein